MSKFTTIFDELITTTIPSLTGFNTKTQLPNPYNLILNDVNLLNNGWGILIGDSSNADYNELNSVWTEQEVSFVLTRVVRATHHNKTPLESTIKSLVEDAILIKIDLLNNDQITIPASIQKIDYINRTAIEFIDAQEYNILTTTINFNFVISESI